MGGQINSDRFRGKYQVIILFPFPPNTNKALGAQGSWLNIKELCSEKFFPEARASVANSVIPAKAGI
jgi:hypothetical protein